jgi:hypothetical protein
MRTPHRGGMSSERGASLIRVLSHLCRRERFNWQRRVVAIDGVNPRSNEVMAPHSGTLIEQDHPSVTDLTVYRSQKPIFMTPAHHEWLIGCRAAAPTGSARGSADRAVPHSHGQGLGRLDLCVLLLEILAPGGGFGPRQFRGHSAGSQRIRVEELEACGLRIFVDIQADCTHLFQGGLLAGA